MLSQRRWPYGKAKSILQCFPEPCDNHHRQIHTPLCCTLHRTPHRVSSSCNGRSTSFRQHGSRNRQRGMPRYRRPVKRSLCFQYINGGWTIGTEKIALNTDVPCRRLHHEKHGHSSQQRCNSWTTADLVNTRRHHIRIPRYRIPCHNDHFLLWTSSRHTY